MRKINLELKAIIMSFYFILFGFQKLESLHLQVNFFSSGKQPTAPTCLQYSLPILYVLSGIWKKI
jgi:hypothetical protein